MAIPPRFMAELRDRLSLSEIIGRRVKLTRAGREYKGCCPFHNEKSPSFYVNDDKQFYHCFGCGAHGDAIGFVMQHDNLSFIEAIEFLATQAGMQVPQQTPQEVERAKKEKSLYTLMDDAAAYFTKALHESKEGRDGLAYLKERGVAPELMETFRLGFSPQDGQALRRYLKSKEYTDDQMVEAGLIRKSDRGGEPYSFFRDRVMFPVTDRRGRVVAFGARVLPEHIRPVDPAHGKPPKYINSSETPIFHKGRMLFNESHARQAAAEGKPIIVVEGYLDVMSCFNAGYRGAVAPLGTALTEEQIAALWKAIPAQRKAPVLCFDGDDAGRRAAWRAVERILPLLQPDHTALIAFLPQGQDPDSLIRAEGAKAFEAFLANALPLAEFLWNARTAGRGLSTPEDRAGLEKILNEDVARIADKNIQHHYQQFFKEKLYQTFAASRPQQQQAKAQNNFSPRGGKKSTPLPPPVKLPSPMAVNAPLILLATLLNHPGLFDRVEEEAAHLDLGNSRLNELRQAAVAALTSDPGLDREALQTHLKDKGFSDILENNMFGRVYVHARFARPEAEDHEAFEGWRETVDFNHRKRALRELKEAGQALKDGAGDQDVEKWQALHQATRLADD